MTPNPYIYEKLIATHNAQIKHDMQQSRMLAQVGQRRELVRPTIGRLGTLLVVLGSYLLRTGHQNKASFPSS